MEKKEIIIIGAGISGLSLAYFLKRANREFHLFEGGAFAGGAIKTMNKDGWVLETGPNTILLTNRFFKEMVENIGLENELLRANLTAKKRFIIRNKKPVALPGSPISFFLSRLFSLKTKIGLMKEPFISKSTDDDESLASFVTRRLGSEFLDYAINPFVAGVYAGKPENLSVKYGFPKLHEIEQKHGSLILGALKGPGKDKDPSDIPRTKAPMVTFRKGNTQLIEGIQDFLGDDSVSIGQTITEIEKISTGYIIRCSNKKIVETKQLILTIPIHSMSNIKWTGFEFLTLPETLKNIKYPPVTVVHLGFKKKQIAHLLNGFGALVPEVEDMNILGVLFNSSIFPNRTPTKDDVLLTVFIGGTRNPEITLMEDNELLSIILEDLKKLLGITGQPIMARTTKWKRAIPQYETGYAKVYKTFEELELNNKGIHFLGNYRNGISVADCVKNAALLSNKI